MRLAHICTTQLIRRRSPLRLFRTFSMESSKSIINRLAGRGAAPVFTDAMGTPMAGTTTLEVEGQVARTDAASDGATQATDGSNKVGGDRSMISTAINAVGKMAGAISSSASSSGPNSVSGALAPTITSAHGYPLEDPSHCLNIAGFPVVSDTTLFEKQQTFNRQKIVERAVHACGSGAFGYFEVTADVSQYTKAGLFSHVGKQTPLVARFSTVTYGREFPDSARNPRGLAFKFYTEEGNYDILSVNFPCFFVRDPSLGPDNIRSQQRHPQNFQVAFDNMFDFMSLVPESSLCNTWFWSDHGTPYGWRFMDGYPIHTFRWVNEAGAGVYIRYRFKSEQGLKNFTFQESVQMCGEDPDFAKRDLWQHIASGQTAVWTVQYQMMTEEQSKTYKFDPFDATKTWLESDFPYTSFGRIVLDRNPENYHRDVEQVAFSPGRLVPGIEPSPDPLLQFRMFLYTDAQYYRLGVNYHQIPVNCPFMTKNYHPATRDGKMRVDNNGGVESPIYPNSSTNPPPARPDPRAIKSPVQISGTLGRFAASKHETGNPDEEYVQARMFYLESLSEADRQNLFINIAKPLSTVTVPDIQVRFLIQCYKIHPSYAAGVITALQPFAKNLKVKIDLPLIEKNAANVKGHTAIQGQAYAPVPVTY